MLQNGRRFCTPLPPRHIVGVNGSKGRTGQANPRLPAAEPEKEA